jgi:UDP-N-acetyl-D-galactosamine dehydrogenase
VIDVIRRLEALGHDVSVHDPLADPAEATHEYAVDLKTGPIEGRYDLVVVAVPHQAYAGLSDDQLAGTLAPGGLFADLKNLMPVAPCRTAWTGGPCSLQSLVPRIAS